MAHSGTGISASLIILIIVASAIGAVIGLLLEGVVPGSRVLAVTAGLVATVVASIARYKLVFLGAGKGADESRIPMVVVVNAAIASIAGSLAAHDLANLIETPASSVFIGTLAGLLSAVLMGLLMITYHSERNPRR